MNKKFIDHIAENVYPSLENSPELHTDIRDAYDRWTQGKFKGLGLTKDRKIKLEEYFGRADILTDGLDFEMESVSDLEVEPLSAEDQANLQYIQWRADQPEEVPMFTLYQRLQYWISNMFNRVGGVDR